MRRGDGSRQKRREIGRAKEQIKQEKICAKTDGQVTEKMTSRTRGSKEAELGVCRKGERLGLM